MFYITLAYNNQIYYLIKNRFKVNGVFNLDTFSTDNKKAKKYCNGIKASDSFNHVYHNLHKDLMVYGDELQINLRNGINIRKIVDKII